MAIEMATNDLHTAKIKVIGVGGGGGNAINNMIESDLSGVDFIAANTDKQALDKNKAPIKIQVGIDTTRGLGSGGNPEIGYKSAEESIEEIKKVLDKSDMVFVTAGMGGGSGTGGAPLIAKTAREIGALVVGIVTKPFKWEGSVRNKTADEWINKLRKEVDALIVIPNQRLLEIVDSNIGFSEAFKKVDEVLYNATKGIADIVSKHGYINVDFADVRAVMKGMGDALMGIGKANGEQRAEKATKAALNSPLLDGITIKGAKGVLVNISGSKVGMLEVSTIIEMIEKEVAGETNLIHGIVETDEDSDEIMVCVVATGFNVEEDKSVNQAQRPITQPLFHDNNVTPRKPKVNNPMYGASHSNVENVPNQDFNITIPQTPKGTESLRMHDRPAWERRGTEIPSLAFSANGNRKMNGKH